MSQLIQKAWTFGSESNPNKTYQTLQYNDSSTSCNCPGWWTRRVASDGSRTCKHTRSVDMGRADIEALSFHEYNAPQKTAAVQAKAKTVPAPRKKLMAAPARKVVW